MLLPCAPISPTQVCCQPGVSCRSRTAVAAPAPMPTVCPSGPGSAEQVLSIVSIVPNNARPLSLSINLLQPWTANSKASPSPNTGLP